MDVDPSLIMGFTYENAIRPVDYEVSFSRSTTSR